MKSLLLFLVYRFAGAGVFTFLETWEETNKEIYDITDKEFEQFAVAVYKAVCKNKTLDWSYQ